MFQATTLWLAACGCLLAGGTVRASGVTTYCNPLDVEYRYNSERQHTTASYRSGADPVIINHKGSYHLFATNSGGWWHSNDLTQWRFIKPDLWPKEDIVSPAAVSAGDALYIFPSSFEQHPIYRTTTPETGALTVFNPQMPFIPGATGPWDPSIFRDDDTGRWFMFFGSSNVYPIYGIELDFKKQLSYIGTSKELIALKPELHGWERFGRDHRDTIKPFIEGAWMTKHAGRYYLQYAAPGTEYNVYANGVYVCDTPLGKFQYAPNNPVSYKPGGCMTGAGHGNIFQDRFGNHWSTGTAWIGVNYPFERRIVMFPAAFDADGLFHVNTRFGDFPHHVPTGGRHDSTGTFAGWMLLSYRRPCTSSPSRVPYPAANVTDENPRTYWQAASTEPGQWLAIDLEGPCDVQAVQVNYADHQSGIFGPGPDVYTQFRLQHSTNGREWEVLADMTGDKRDRPNAYIELPRPLRTRHIRFEHVHVGAPNLAVSDIRVFGHGGGEAPPTPTRLVVRRDEEDPRNAFLSWGEVPGAVGYNVLWGIQSDKLYQTYQVFADFGTRLEIRALNISQPYSFSIEAFNESGVSKQSETVRIE